MGCGDREDKGRRDWGRKGEEGIAIETQMERGEEEVRGEHEKQFRWRKDSEDSIDGIANEIRNYTSHKFSNTIA